LELNGTRILLEIMIENDCLWLSYFN